MYEFLTGPMLWITFAVFIIGSLTRIVLYFRGLSWQLDRVAYTAQMGAGLKGAARSIFYWLVPFGTHSWRKQPFITVVFFVFHVGLIVTPLFLTAHAVILKERFGIGWPTLPGAMADALSIGVLIAGVLLILRRIALPQDRILTTFNDYFILAIAVAPFVTGLLARFQAPGHETWLLAHIISGHIWLLAIPFTKLCHAVLFFCTRAQLGMDYGIKRGGMKGKKGFAW